jgi:hypothetical protein
VERVGPDVGVVAVTAVVDDVVPAATDGSDLDVLVAGNTAGFVHLDRQMGGANWWLPRWLDRILPRVHIDGPEDRARPGPDDLSRPGSADTPPPPPALTPAPRP